jgi:hypothetical protein
MHHEIPQIVIQSVGDCVAWVLQKIGSELMLKVFYLLGCRKPVIIFVVCRFGFQERPANLKLYAIGTEFNLRNDLPPVNPTN